MVLLILLESNKEKLIFHIGLQETFLGKYLLAGKLIYTYNFSPINK